MLTLDDLLKDIGEFGTYQKRVFAIVCVIVFTDSWVSVISVFLSASVDHWCVVPEWRNFSCLDDGLSFDECEEAKRYAAIPFNFTSDGQLGYDQCLRYNVSGVDFWPGLLLSNSSNGTLHTVACDHGWVYDTSQYKSSTVTEYDLVCEKEALPDLIQSIYYGGALTGSIVFGSMADIVGRWKTLMVCLILRLIAGIALAFSPTWWVFAIFRFVQGTVSIAIYLIAFIIGTEFVGPSKRNITGLLAPLPYAFGYMSLALLAYLFRYWKTLEIVVTIPVVFYIAMMFLLPESVRWQISVGKYDEAEKSLWKIAKTNKVQQDGSILRSGFLLSEENDPIERHHTALDIFRMPRMRSRSIHLIFSWMVISMVYHGLSLSSSNFGINDYLAFAVSGIVEIPAYLLSAYIIEVIGRKFSLCICLLLSGVACLCTSFISPGAGLTTVAMIGKFGISAAYAILYLYTVELYPTAVRSAGLGTCSMFARAADMVAPLILILDKVWRPLPLIIYGGVSIIAGVFSLLLPETRGQKLPETMEEGENFGRKADRKNDSEGGNKKIRAEEEAVDENIKTSQSFL